MSSRATTSIITAVARAVPPIMHSSLPVFIGLAGVSGLLSAAGCQYGGHA